jgi:hypothetical protein
LALLLDIPLERKKDPMGLIVLSQVSRQVVFSLHSMSDSGYMYMHPHKYIHPKRKKKKKNQKPIERKEIPLKKLTKRPKDTIWMR